MRPAPRPPRASDALSSSASTPAACAYRASATPGLYLSLLSRLVYLGDFVVRELELSGGDVLLEMLDRPGAGDRQHHRRALQQPGQRDLPGGGVVRRRDLGDGAARLGQLAGRQREPRDEADALLLAV